LPGRPQLLDQGDLIFAAVDGGAHAIVDQQQFMNPGASAIAGEITPAQPLGCHSGVPTGTAICRAVSASACVG
jgi:hypothetical protein